MARATRDAKLETRTGRDRLPVRHQPYFRLIGHGLYLGYRKGVRGGTWIVRHFSGGKYVFHTLGEADDYRDANDLDVLNYFQGQDKARKYADECIQRERNTGISGKPLTVADVMTEYVKWYAVNRRAITEVQYRINVNILPFLGSILVSQLTTREIRKWHESLAATPPKLRNGKSRIVDEADSEVKRKRKSTANKSLIILRAALNYAWREGLVSSDEAWRKVLPFRDVERPRVRYLSIDECVRLINACDPDLRLLVQGALLTGGRYGELIAMQCADYSVDSGTIYLRKTKNGKPRHVPLTDEGIKFFDGITAGRPAGDILFTFTGKTWKKSEQSRPMKKASKGAGIFPLVSFHVLRHTYATLLALRGVSLQAIAGLLGHANTTITEKHYSHMTEKYLSDQVRANLPNFGIKKSNVRILKQGAQKNE